MTIKNNCIILDCDEAGVIEIFNPTLKKRAFICITHVSLVNAEEE